MADSMNEDKKVRFQLNRSVNILDESETKQKGDKEQNRRQFKKKTLRRITLDPPDELDSGHENDQIIQKPEDVSRSLIYGNNNDATSKSLIFSPGRRLKPEKKISSFSTNKLRKIEKKNESKKVIEQYN